MDIDDIRRILPRLLDHSNAAVAIKDINGVYLFANREYGRYANAPAEYLIGLCDREFLAPERLTALAAAEQSALADQASVRSDESFLVADLPVWYRSTRFPILDDHHQTIALGIVAMDVSEQHRSISEAEQALQAAEETNAQLREEIEVLVRLASTDRLTDAWNRRRFEEAIEAEVHRSNRYGQPLTLLLLDIDHFKAVNDQFGHQAGDQVLVEVAHCIREAMRKSDSLTRWGGEEFIVLMPNTALDNARILAERVRENIAARPIEGVGKVTASIGVAEYIPTSSSAEWLDRADQAMFRAKHEGRNRVEVDARHGSTQRSGVALEGAFVQLLWKNTFLSGNHLIDSQHEELFHRANELLDAVLSGRPNEAIATIVNRLLTQTERHFQDEERILGELSFPGLPEHAAEHAELLAKGQELAHAFADGSLSVGSLFQFLAYDLVTRHMLGSDRAFFPLIASRAAAELE